MRSFVLFVSLAPAVFAAAPPLQYFDLGSLKLHSSETIQDCRLAYRTYGTLNAAKSNAVIFPTWFSGRSEDLDGQITQWFDASRDFVIAVDAIGNGVSCSPSNSKRQPGLEFPKFDIHGMVAAEYRLATEKFGLKKLHAVIGISMGGMQAFEWVAAYPDFVERAIPIVGSPRLASSDILLWSAEAAAIENHSTPDLRAVAAIHTFALTSPGNLARELKPEDTAARIEKEVAGIKRMDPTDWLYQLRAMMAQNVAEHAGGNMAEAARRVKAKTLVVVAAQDHMVNPAPARDFARLGSMRVLELQSDCGHLSPGCEAGILAAAVRAFLK